MLLRERSRDGYATVTNYIGIIQEHEHSGMQVHQSPPVFQLNGNSAYYSVTWCAGVIAHDSIHSKLYFDYKKQHPWSLWVPARTYGGDDAEHACLEHQLSVLKDDRRTDERNQLVPPMRDPDEQILGREIQKSKLVTNIRVE